MRKLMINPPADRPQSHSWDTTEPWPYDRQTPNLPQDRTGPYDVDLRRLALPPTRRTA
jgi:hypothetical protein